MQAVNLYTVDLTRISGKGEFKCPKCGVEFSPNDRTENTYTILEPVVNEDSLEKVILPCNTCGSQIHLAGFQLLRNVR